MRLWFNEAKTDEESTSTLIKQRLKSWTLLPKLLSVQGLR